MVELLREIGLNKYESKVYFALIEEGLSTAKNISDITGIPYGKVYETVSGLSLKGFVFILPNKPMKCKAISPTEAVKKFKIKQNEIFMKVEKEIIKEMEPMFIDSKQFEDPRGTVTIINGRTNLQRYLDVLFSNAKENIKIICSENTLSRLILHKEKLEKANSKGVKINILSSLDNGIKEEAKTLSFCGIRRIKNPGCNYYSIDSKNCVIVEAVPDDQSIIYGRDKAMIFNSQPFTKFINHFFDNEYKTKKDVYDIKK